MMNGTITAVARLRAWAGHSGGVARPGRLARGLGLVLLAALLVPAFLMATSSPASADDKKERDNYSLYQLASNASSYFSEKNSPQNDKGMHENWKPVTSSPAAGGSMLGYADPEFSLGNIVGWFFAEVSGSSQTVTYQTLAAKDDKGNAKYSGMLDYAHFGAANNDLGLDTMSSGIGGQIVSVIGGSIIWVLYALALAVGTLFYVIIQFLKLINPFTWFYSAVAAVNPTLAEGMTGGDTGGGALSGLQHWISSWYGLLVDISWQALVPIFIGVLLIGLVMFKKMDRGSAIKKLIVRVVFIGVGLPLVGSMYSSVLGKFDDSVLGQHAGPTRVVLSTYVDFEAWMMNDRLGIPDQATVSWNGDQASPDAMMSVRTSALAINKQSHGTTFNGINIGTKANDAESAWKDGTVSVTGGSASDDFKAVFSTFGIIGKYIASSEVAASDFESGIKSSITQLDESSGVKKSWFVDKSSYGDVEEFGEEKGPKPVDHPVISTDGTGLTSSGPGKDSTVFTTTGTKAGCGFTVGKAPSSCNLSPLTAYNYLNTGFSPSSLTMYSSNNATSGFTRENHMAVSQVGTGPAKFMYWSNAATVLGSIVLLGFWYAIGMLAGSVKRIFGLVAAVPFATLGAMQAISKVIVYSMALILEVLLTLFIYQFVSEFLISVPDIMAGPVSSFMSPGGLWGSAALGGIIVVILTLISSLVIMGITFALLRVRKTVLQAMDEVVTKLVDKFLETNTTPKPDKGGLMPALAAGAGAGAGMAMGNKLANGFNSKTNGPVSPSTGKPAGKTASTNAGGTNGDAMALTSGQQQLALGGGGQDGPDGPDSPALDGGPGGGSGGGSDEVKALSGGSGPAGVQGASGRDGLDDKGGPLQLTSGGAGSSRSDKQTALGLSNQGGLSILGYTSDGNKVIPGEVLASSTDRSSSHSGAQGQSRAGSTDSVPTSGDRKAVAGQTGPTQFGTGSQGAQRQQGSNQQAAPQRFSGDAVPAPAPASGQPAAPSTRPTRSAQGTPAPRQLGAGTSDPRPVAASASASASGRTPAAPGARTPARTQAARQPGSIQASTSTPRQTPAPRAQAPRPPAPAPAPVPRPRPRPRRVADPAPQSVETPEPQQRPAGGLRRGRREED
ncbi:hypothetical protein [Streptomyces sp. NPDC048142]|uniref:hypothetical protein n=1 Tax=Streptomyces sp. NPDC048142 TaxID=3365501 RepID=UPI00370FC319